MMRTEKIAKWSMFSLCNKSNIAVCEPLELSKCPFCVLGCMSLCVCKRIQLLGMLEIPLRVLPDNRRDLHNSVLSDRTGLFHHSAVCDVFIVLSQLSRGMRKIIGLCVYVRVRRAAWFRVMLAASEIPWKENEKHNKGENDLERERDKERVITGVKRIKKAVYFGKNLASHSIFGLYLCSTYVHTYIHILNQDCIYLIKQYSNLLKR